METPFFVPEGRWEPGLRRLIAENLKGKRKDISKGLVVCQCKFIFGIILKKS